MGTYSRLPCFRRSPALRSLVSLISFGSSTTYKPTNSGLGWGELGPGWKISSCRELEVASGSSASSDSGIVWSGRLGPNLQDENEASGVGAAIRSTYASVFFILFLFFFSFVARGRAAGEKSRPFSPGAFLNVPSCLFSSRWSRRSWRTFESASRALL